MIIKADEERLAKIREILVSKIRTSETQIDWEMTMMLEVFDRMVNAQRIAHESYSFCDEKDIAKGFYTAECLVCGWWGSSRLLDGGKQIADTGDYSDPSCPACAHSDITEKFHEN